MVGRRCSRHVIGGPMAVWNGVYRCSGLVARDRAASRHGHRAQWHEQGRRLVKGACPVGEWTCADGCRVRGQGGIGLQCRQEMPEIPGVQVLSLSRGVGMEATRDGTLWWRWSGCCLPQLCQSAGNKKAPLRGAFAGSWNGEAGIRLRCPVHCRCEWCRGCSCRASWRCRCPARGAIFQGQR